MTLLEELRRRMQAVQETTGQIITFLEGETDPPVYFMPMPTGEDTQPLDIDALRGADNG